MWSNFSALSNHSYGNLAFVVARARGQVVHHIQKLEFRDGHIHCFSVFARDRDATFFRDVPRYFLIRFKTRHPGFNPTTGSSLHHANIRFCRGLERFLKSFGQYCSITLSLMVRARLLISGMCARLFSVAFPASASVECQKSKNTKIVVIGVERQQTSPISKPVW